MLRLYLLSPDEGRGGEHQPGHHHHLQVHRDQVQAQPGVGGVHS